MEVRELVAELDLVVKACTHEGSLREITGGYCGDVLSHVMANAKPGYAWFTVQSHENVIAVATLTDVACVVVCGREIPPEVEQRALHEGVTLLWSSAGVFETAGKAYQLMRLRSIREAGKEGV